MYMDQSLSFVNLIFYFWITNTVGIIVGGNKAKPTIHSFLQNLSSLSDFFVLGAPDLLVPP